MTPVGSFTIEADHPSLPGHFPAQPVVPGVVLLDRALIMILAAQQARAAGLPSVKFIRPVRPGQEVVVACAPSGEGRIAFVCSVEDVPVVRGSLVL